MVLSTLADGSEKMCYLNLKHAAVVFVALLSIWLQFGKLLVVEATVSPHTFVDG